MSENREDVLESIEAVLSTEPELDAIAASPQRWEEINDETFIDVLNRELIRYALTSDPALIHRLMALYNLSIERLSPEERMEFLSLAIGLVDRAPGVVNILNPFIFIEQESSIVSSAAMALAVQMPPIDDDPLTGPKYMRALVDKTDDHELKANLICGLLLLGDFRIQPLIEGIWNLVSAEYRPILTWIRTDFPSAFLVNFYLDWLEAVVASGAEEEFAAVAAALARTAIEHDYIVDIERKFPSWDEDGKPPITFHSRSTIKQLGKSIEHRLRDVMELESEPKVMPHVIEYWGLCP